MTSKAESVDGVPGWTDPVIVEMLKRLPARGAVWSVADRLEWLRAMESILDMVYGPAERIEIEWLVPGDTLSDPGTAPIKSSAEPTDEAMAGAEGVASGSGDAKTTEAPEETRMGSERSSSAETVQEAARIISVEASKANRNVGGAPSKAGRPASIPTNLAIAVEAIAALGGAASGPQIRDWARVKYWAAMPDSWTAVLYDFVKAEKLARSGINFVLPGAAKSSPAPAISPPKVAPLAPKVAPKPTIPAPKGVEFNHGDKSVMLPTSRYYIFASKLRIAMGKGHISEAFLAQEVIGSNTEKHRDEVRHACLAMNKQLAEIGLKIEYYPGFGLIMKEVS